ncbi:MAG: DUF4367 domain-containing protein [Oscillospiraceae bacterium]
MSREEFKAAFREIVSSEFAHIPTDESSIDFTFSEKFNKKMEKLIKSQRKPYWNFISTVSRRAAAIIVAIITLVTAAFSVKAIREPIIKFIKQVYESFTHYSFDGDTVEIITKEYTITQMLDGYEQFDKLTSENTIATTYKNKLGDTIIFTQMTTEYSIGYFVDNESGEQYTETVDDIEIEFKEWYDTKTAIWANDGYVFSIDCIGNISFEDIKQIIRTIK